MSDERRSLRRFFTAIDRKYSAIRGVPAATSPRDVSVVLEWFEMGVPLGVVLRTLDEMAERHQKGSSRDQPIRSLRFARRSVEKRFKEYRRLTPRRGERGSDDFSRSVLAGSLESMAAKLEATALRERDPSLVDRIGGRLRELACSLPEPVPVAEVSRLEEELSAFDDEISSRVREVFAEELRTARAEAEQMLSTYAAGMGARAHDEAVASRADGILRRRLSIPRVANFYLEESG